MKFFFLYIFFSLLVHHSAHADEKPNVIFIVIDDMNDWISLLDNNSPIKTPNLIRLAERGMLFTKAYCPSPACNPSRVSVLTGLRPYTPESTAIVAIGEKRFQKEKQFFRNLKIMVMT